MKTLTEEQVEELIDLLILLSKGGALLVQQVLDNDPYSPWAYECPSCFKKSTDRHSDPPHSDDCDLMEQIEMLRS